MCTSFNMHGPYLSECRCNSSFVFAHARLRKNALRVLILHAPYYFPYPSREKNIDCTDTGSGIKLGSTLIPNK